MRTPEELLLAVGVREWWDSGAEDYEEFVGMLIKLVKVAQLEQKSNDIGIVDSFYNVMRQYTTNVPDITQAIIDNRRATKQDYE